ncbi:hypothetical protein ENBRE01_0323 [Enteropsectra breve]|nr:hypothetical protein ENBRE01_0323 [Enteropsectra breve]
MPMLGSLLLCFIASLSLSSILAYFIIQTSKAKTKCLKNVHSKDESKKSEALNVETDLNSANDIKKDVKSNAKNVNNIYNAAQRKNNLTFEQCKSTFRTMKPKNACKDKGPYEMAIVINKEVLKSKEEIFALLSQGMDSMVKVLKEYPFTAAQWERSGTAKIVLKGSTGDMEIIKEKVKSSNLISLFCETKMVIIGPGPKKEIKPITERLSLY